MSQHDVVGEANLTRLPEVDEQATQGLFDAPDADVVIDLTDAPSIGLLTEEQLAADFHEVEGIRLQNVIAKAMERVDWLSANRAGGRGHTDALAELEKLQRQHRLHMSMSDPEQEPEPEIVDELSYQKPTQEELDADYYPIEGIRLEQQLQLAKTRIERVLTNKGRGSLTYKAAKSEFLELQAAYRQHNSMSLDTDQEVLQDLLDYDPDAGASQRATLPVLTDNEPNFGIAKLYHTSEAYRPKHMQTAPERLSRLSSLQNGLGRVAQMGVTALHAAKSSSQRARTQIQVLYSKITPSNHAEVKPTRRIAATAAVGSLAVASLLGVLTYRDSVKHSPQLPQPKVSAEQLDVAQTTPTISGSESNQVKTSHLATANTAPKTTESESTLPESTTNYQQVSLNRGGTISDLVLKQLRLEGVRTGPNGKVAWTDIAKATNQVLSDNDLDWEGARHIPADQIIKVHTNLNALLG